MPLDVGDVVRQLGAREPFRLLDTARGDLAAGKTVDAVNLLLVDYALEVLRPFGGYQDRRWVRSHAGGRRGAADGSAIGVRYRHITPEMEARAVAAIEQRLAIARKVAKEQATS